MPAARLKTFGAPALIPLAASTDSGAIKHKPLLVLAALAAEGSAGATRDFLIGLFWPEKSQEKARASLANAIFEWRRALGPNVLIEGPGALQIDAAILRSDVEGFVRAIARGDDDAAIAEYTGPFLDGVTAVNAPEFQRWVARRRSGYATMFVQALTRTAAGASDVRDHAKAVNLLRRAVAADPLSGQATMALMRALERNGEPTTALELGDAYIALLRDRHDAAPDPDIVDEMTRLRSGPDKRGQPRATAAPAPARTSGPTGPGIGVLDFESLGTERDDQVFATGIAIELSDTLMRGRQLRVIPRLAMLDPAARSDLPALGRRVDARYFVEGTVKRDRARLRVSARLIDLESPGDANSLGAFDREVTDLFAMQDEIAGEIARHVLPMVTHDRPRRRRFALEATEQFLRGRFHWDSRAPDRMQRSLECYEAAIAREPDFATALACAAEAHAGLAIFGARPPREALAQAETSARRALGLDPSLEQAHTALGAVHAIRDWDWPAAAADFQRALDQNPQYATARTWRGILQLLPTGRIDDALADMRAARQLDPISWVVTTLTGMCLYFRRDFDEAAREIRVGFGVEPDYAPAHYFLARALAELGDVPAAQHAFERALALSGGDAQVLSAQACAFAAAGDEARARELLGRIEDQAATRFVSACQAANVRAALGDLDAAAASYERGAEERAVDMLWLPVHSALAPLRRHPRVIEILKQMRV